MYFDAHATGKRIQKARKAHGLTQEQFAIKLNISDRHLGRIERGRMCRFDRPAGRSGSIFENHTGLFDLRRDRNSTGKGAERID